MKHYTERETVVLETKKPSAPDSKTRGSGDSDEARIKKRDILADGEEKDDAALEQAIRVRGEAQAVVFQSLSLGPESGAVSMAMVAVASLEQSTDNADVDEWVD